MKKNKIMILVNHDIVIYNFRRELVERLIFEGYYVVISSPYGERIDKLKEMGCKYIPATIQRHGKNIVKDIKLINHYKKIMKEEKPNVILTYTIKPNIYGGIAAKSLSIPYIANITGLGTAVENSGILQKLSLLLYKYAFSDIQTVFFQNIENMQFFIKNEIAISKHKLIPGSGVNLNHFTVLEYPTEDKIEFIFISRIMKEKGIDQYLKAAEFIKNKYPNTFFHVCGFCEENYEEILKLYEAQGIIKYHGMINDVRDILKQTHCTVHPSFYPEGISNVLLESAACGRPLITTNRSGCREVVDDGTNGFIIKEKNTKDLIDKIEKFIKLSYDDKKKMRLAGRYKVEKEFDRLKVIEAYKVEIENALR